MKREKEERVREYRHKMKRRIKGKEEELEKRMA